MTWFNVFGQRRPQVVGYWELLDSACFATNLILDWYIIIIYLWLLPYTVDNIIQVRLVEFLFCCRLSPLLILPLQLIMGLGTILRPHSPTSLLLIQFIDTLHFIHLDRIRPCIWGCGVSDGSSYGGYRGICRLSLLWGYFPWTETAARIILPAPAN